MKSLGRHLVAEFYDCDRNVLDDVEAIEKHMKTAAHKSNATIVNTSFHRFLPYGVSGVVVIPSSENTIPRSGFSNISILCISLWPE